MEMLHKCVDISMQLCMLDRISYRIKVSLSLVGMFKHKKILAVINL